MAPILIGGTHAQRPNSVLAEHCPANRVVQGATGVGTVSGEPGIRINLEMEGSSGVKRLLGLVFVLGLVATPAMAQKITIDYAHDFDFSSVDTYQYVVTEESNMENSLMSGRVVGYLRQALREGGLKAVENNPDVLVTYHITTQDRTSYNTTNFGYGGYWGGWGGYGGLGTSTTTATNYTEGTLIIDAYDAKEKKMVWRGTGTVTVKAKPEKQARQIENIFDKLGSKWDKILAGKGK